MTSSTSGGLDKPYDRFFKSIAEEAPRMLLHLLGIAPLEAEVVMTPLPRETSPPVKMTDYAAVVAVHPESPFVFHTEFLVWYRGITPSEMARYGISLALQHRMPVVSVLVLLRPEGAPKWIPDEGEFRIGETRAIHPFRTVRFWEIDANPLLQGKDPRLLPWAVLMNTSDAQVRQIAKELVQHGDEELLGRFLSLGTLRYHREQLEEMIGGPAMGIVEAILEGSSMVREMRERALEEGLEKGLERGIEKGLEKGMEKGKEEGREGATRDLLRSVLVSKYPGLELLPEIDSIPFVSLQPIFQEVLRATDRAQVERAIRTSAASPRS